MKSLYKVAALAVGIAAFGIVALNMSHTSADSPGQLEGGSITYLVKNVTQGGSYSPATSATSCDEVEYSIRLHNTAYGGFSDIQVGVNLPSNSSTSNTSTMTATTNLGGTTGATSTAVVKLNPAGTVNYETGTTVLYDVNGNVIQTLPDTITSSGVDIGGLNGSTTEFVNFKAKVNCPSPVVSFACSGLDVAEVDRTHFNFTAQATVQNANVTSYTFTAKNSKGNVVDTQNLSSSSLTSPVYAFNQTNPDTYTVSAVVNTDHGTSPVGNCVKQVIVQPQTPGPVFACNSLTVVAGANRTITATVSYQATNGATLQSINYDFGDGNTFLTSNTSATHTYGKDNTYTVAATLTFNVGSTSQTARCAQSVTITTPTTPTVVTASTSLPNTGPGDDVAAIFGGATALGAAGHYAVAFRRNRR